MKFFRLLFGTCDSLGPLIMRLGLAIALFPHGAQKVLGWWGGPGFEAMMKIFTGQMQIPGWLAFLAIATEFAAPIALVVGLFTRLAGIAIAVHITVAAILGGHLAHGFFMNWFGNQKGEGIEYHLLMATLGLALFVLGGGKWSLDRLISRRMSDDEPERFRSGE